MLAEYGTRLFLFTLRVKLCGDIVDAILENFELHVVLDILKVITIARPYYIIHSINKTSKANQITQQMNNSRQQIKE